MTFPLPVDLVRVLQLLPDRAQYSYTMRIQTGPQQEDMLTVKDVEHRGFVGDGMQWAEVARGLP